MTEAPVKKSAQPALCKHTWVYNGTDYHGSYKGEKEYRCTLCGKNEYRA
jgi:hypothetical protein